MTRDEGLLLFAGLAFGAYKLHQHQKKKEQAARRRRNARNDRIARKWLKEGKVSQKAWNDEKELDRAHRAAKRRR